MTAKPITIIICLITLGIAVFSSCKKNERKVVSVQCSEKHINNDYSLNYEIQLDLDTSNTHCSMTYFSQKFPRSAKINCAILSALTEEINKSVLLEEDIKVFNENYEHYDCTIVVHFDDGDFKQLGTKKSEMSEAFKKIYNSVQAIYEQEKSNLRDRTSDDVVVNIKKLNYFSSNENKDTFSITAIGNSFLDSNVYFNITNKQGKVLFRDSCQSFWLLNYEFEQWKANVKGTDKEQQEAFIKYRIEHFYDEDNFIRPAISNKSKYAEFGEDGFIDEKVWNRIKSDKTSIGFHYLFGAEDNSEITYDKKEKKVILYSNHD
jgi:hypothetical protein